MSFYQWKEQNLLISCRLQPRASKDEFAGIQGDLLKIRIKAPPVDGNANQHLILFLAKQFKVPKNRIQLVSGETHRIKRVLINNPAQLPQSIPELSLP
ncbi:MAG: YggU family protein [Pseudomonadales bacterium]|nr:YggU family protein [Pseudomonadales bacterium]